MAMQRDTHSVRVVHKVYDPRKMRFITISRERQVMGLYINWPDGRPLDKIQLARGIGGVEVTQEAAAAVINDPDKAVLVWVSNGPFEALAYAFSPREFEAFTLPHDQRPKTFFIVPKAVAEAHAK